MAAHATIFRLAALQHVVLLLSGLRWTCLSFLARTKWHQVMARYLGIVAAVNLWLKNTYIQGARADLALLWLLPVVAIAMIAMGSQDGGVVPWLVLAVVTVIWGGLMQSRLRHDIVFVPTSDEHRVLVESPEVDLTDELFWACGRFVLWEGDRSRFARLMDRLISGTGVDRWFVLVPVRLIAEPDDRGLFAFAAYVDASARFFGIPVDRKSGSWMLEGTFNSVEPAENGYLHFGWKTYVALRIRFRNAKRRRRMIVLTFDDQQARSAFWKHFRAASGLQLPDPT